MKIAIFTDIHGNKEALKAIIDDIKKENVDEIICLGDTVALGPNSNECLDMIINNNIKMTLGNHELYVTRGTEIDDEMDNEVIEHENWVRNQISNEQLLYLNKCPLYMEKDINGKKILFAHFPIIDINLGYPFHDLDIVENNQINEITKELNYDLIFIGHEHKAFTINNKLYCLGSSGCRKDNMTKYIILDTDNFNIEIRNITFDFDCFKEKVLEKDYPCRKTIAEHYYGLNIE